MPGSTRTPHVTQSHPKMALLDKCLYKKGTGVKEEVGDVDG